MTTNPFEDDSLEFLVLINHEEQHSLWPAFRDIPPGWTATGTRGDRQACLDHIERVWTDMRPLSLRSAPGQPASVGPASVGPASVG